MAIKSIYVIGLGEVGTPITGFLLKAGYEVKGYDVRAKRVTDLTAKGLRSANSPKDAAAGSDLVILSLPSWAVVREVVEGKDGVLETAEKGQIIIDCSTVPPHETRAMAQRLSERGVHWMDVPISGSATQARRTL